jgi:3-isopropylmalate/(R)-2-methylmalate dehydratase large subunit
VRPVGELEPTRIDLAYIGACTGAKLEDLRAAARVLAGHRVAANVQLLVAPASLRDAAAAEAEGLVRQLTAAGATWLPSSCGACAGYGGRIPAGSTVISSTARNFKGRMGADDAQVYLGSPYTVAASALRGVISDAREMLA